MDLEPKTMRNAEIHDGVSAPARYAPVTGPVDGRSSAMDAAVANADAAADDEDVVSTKRMIHEPAATGPHDDPTIRGVRRAHHHADDGTAFLPDYRSRRSLGAHDLPDDAEADAEEFLANATLGEPMNEDARDEVTEEELGGPFIELDANARFPADESEQKPLLPESRRARRTLSR